MDNVGFVVKLNRKSYVVGKGLYLSVNIENRPRYLHKMVTTDIAKATIFEYREQAEDIVEEYGGEICEIGLREV